MTPASTKAPSTKRILPNVPPWPSKAPTIAKGIRIMPSPQLREIARRGHEAVGLDLGTKMLRYLQEKAAGEDLKIETVLADMKDLRLRKKCDCAFTLSGSLDVSSTEEFMRHLICVANALNPGGIYLVKNMVLSLKPRYHQRWIMTRGPITVRTEFESVLVDPLRQLYKEKLALRVKVLGGSREYTSVSKIKCFSPQELKSLVESSRIFTFLGFFTHLSLRPLTALENNNFVLIQKALTSTDKRAQ